MMLLIEKFSTFYKILLDLEGEQVCNRRAQMELRYGRLLEDLQGKIAFSASGESRARCLVGNLFRTYEFRFSARNIVEDFTLSGTLLNRAGNCLGLSTLLYSLAINVGIPIVPVLFEGHVACELQMNGEYKHIELSRGGSFLPPRLVKMMHGQERGVPLSDQELIAVHLSNRAAFVLVPQGNLNEALKMLDQSVHLFPGYCGGHINRTTLLFQMGRFTEATEGVGRILSLKPGPRYERAARELMKQIIGATIREVRTSALQ